MARVANAWLFRAEAMRLDWGRVAAFQRQALGRFGAGGRRGAGLDNVTDERWQRARGRSLDIHLWWACARDLGVPLGPFLVWTRPSKDRVEGVDVRQRFTGDGLRLTWGGVEAGCVEVSFAQGDPSRPSALFLYRTGGSLWEAVGAATAPAGAGGAVTLRVRTSGATSALLINGSSPTVRIAALADIVNDPQWKPVELVGLPVDQPWGATDYDPGDQGPLGSPRPPADAAVDRLQRGAPPLGWLPLTQAGRLAPPWEDADPWALLKEVQSSLLPELEPMYRTAVPEPQPHLLEQVRPVDPPQQDGRTSSLGTSATIRPWSLLTLPAQTDPLLNLATGFGATYLLESGERPELAVGSGDLMVTADYRHTPKPLGGGATLAAYAPQTGPHVTTPRPTGVSAERTGLVAPKPPDTPWRESIRVSWDRLPVTAAVGRVGAGALVRYPTSGGLGAPAESLLPPRDAGGWRPLTLSPDAPKGQPGHDRIALVDAAAVIPIGSGGRQMGYAVSVVDIHGVWSPWRDVAYAGDEPGPLAPRLISLTLDTTYAGSSTCPAMLRCEVALDWTERTPTGMEVVALYFPMASATAAPPPGLDPALPTPAGCFRRDFGLSFTGDVPTGAGCSVICLSPSGETVISPGPGQGDGGRRYALTAPVPTLAFTGTQRWGVQVWLRTSLAVGASPTAYAPDAAHPARASAASPVPVQPLPPPAPPGVPLGSTPDSQGCSHVRVAWSLPGGTPVRTCVVWEVAETSLRQRAGLPSRAPETDSPGVRLAALWAAYDAMTDTQRRGAFRRILEVDGAVRSADVTLPKGSTDIHLFTVTTQSMTGIESPWPSVPGPAHVHLQAATAPRLRRPAPPLARAVVQADGTVALTLLSASTVPVDRFLVFATRSEAAARDRESMGPPVATVPVTGSPVATDPVTGSPIYQATGSLALAASWDPWLVRAVAQPVDTVPVQAVRGIPSAASEITSVLALPTGAPDLAPLTADVWGADHRGVLVRSSTSAPARATGAGSHRISAAVAAGGAGGGGGGVGQVLPLAALESLAETPGTTPPPDAATRLILERGTRAAGRSPLVLWFTRPVAADPVDVTLRLVDPLGRATEAALTVPGYVPPPPLSVVIVSARRLLAGVLLGVDTDAPAAASEGLVLHVRAVHRGGGHFPAVELGSPEAEEGTLGAGEEPSGSGAVGRLRPVPLQRRSPAGEARLGRGRILLPRRVLEATFPLAEIPVGDTFFPADGQIHVVRPRRRGLPEPPRYAVWVPALPPLDVVVSIVSPDGSRVSASRTL